MDLESMEKLFKIEKVGKSGVKFDPRKLEFFNQSHIKNKFTYFEDKAERQQCVNEWRNVLLETMPAHLHRRIRQTSDPKILSIMDMMKVRIHFYKDLLNHTYFFEEPFYNSEHARKFIKKLKQPN